MHTRLKTFGLIVAIAMSCGQNVSATPINSYFLHLAECSQPGQEASATLVNRDGRLEIALMAQERRFAVPAAAGFAIEPITSNSVTIKDFDTQPTFIVFDFLGKPPRSFNLFLALKFKDHGALVEKDVLIDSNGLSGTIPLIQNADGSWTASVTSARILAASPQGTPSLSTQLNSVSVVFQPIVKEKTDTIFVRSVKFLNQDPTVNIKIGVGGCDLLTNRH